VPVTVGRERSGRRGFLCITVAGFGAHLRKRNWEPTTGNKGRICGILHVQLPSWHEKRETQGEWGVKTIQGRLDIPLLLGLARKIQKVRGERKK